MSKIKIKKIVLIGHPVSHSLSPVMHNAGFKELNLDFVYNVLDVLPEDLEKAIIKIRDGEIYSANVTIPHKVSVKDFLDDLTDEARSIGAVNTIIRDKDMLIGDNTDGRGFIRSLKEGLKVELAGKNVFVFGAGGAARAIVVSLLKENVSKIYLNDIVLEKATDLSGVDKKIEVVNSCDIERAIKDSILLVNATPCGMDINDNCTPFPTEFIKNDSFVYDIVYNRETHLIKFCKENGIKCLSGLEMLLYQGVLGFESWTGKKAPVETMRKALIKEMQNEK